MAASQRIKDALARTLADPKLGPDSPRAKALRAHILRADQNLGMSAFELFTMGAKPGFKFPTATGSAKKLTN